MSEELGCISWFCPFYDPEHLSFIPSTIPLTQFFTHPGFAFPSCVSLDWTAPFMLNDIAPAMSECIQTDVPNIYGIAPPSPFQHLSSNPLLLECPSSDSTAPTTGFWGYRDPEIISP